MDENNLITASQHGDLNAFEELIKPYEQRVYNFLLKMCKEPEIAADMTQETFINVFRKIKDFRGEAKFSTWVFQIATNNCLMQKRKQNNQLLPLENPWPGEEKEINLEVPDWTQNPAELYEQAELKELLDQALAGLPEIYRAVFMLKDIEGFKSKEIAEMLHISIANVKARILRARIMLQNILKEKLAHA